ncbi:unnamed protein product [Prunus brigantina]
MSKEVKIGLRQLCTASCLYGEIEQKMFLSSALNGLSQFSYMASQMTLRQVAKYPPLQVFNCLEWQ